MYYLHKESIEKLHKNICRYAQKNTAVAIKSKILHIV